MKLSRLNLVRLSRVTRTGGATQYGDPCPHCQGAVGVYCVENAEQRTIRYLGCKSCGWKPRDSKWVTSESVETKGGKDEVEDRDRVQKLHALGTENPRIGWLPEE